MQRLTSFSLKSLVRLGGAILLTCLMSGVARAQAMIPSGTFQFTTSSYSVSDNEINPPADPGLTLHHSLLGARVTVTRSDGDSGRVWVPVLVTQRTDYSVTTVTMSTNDTTTVTVPIPSTNTPIILETNTLIFDDYQMSASLLLQPSQYGSVITSSPITTNIDSTTSTTNLIYTNTIVSKSLVLDTPVLDPLESSDLLPPALGAITSETINVLKSSGSGANSVLNLERATFRVDKDETTVAVIHVRRSGGAGDQAVTVNYDINQSLPHPVKSGFGGNPNPGNTFALEAGSDYAVDGEDFTSVSGTLSWGANDGNDKTITIPILNDGQVKFNRDLQVQLWIPVGSTEPAVVGEVSKATLTILSDSFVAGQQSAGSVDRTWNKDNSDGFDSNPPYLRFPGTKGGVSDTANGNGGTVYAAVEQPDGKAIIAGSFNSFDSNPYNRIVRLLPNGYQDPTFLAAPNSGANDVINTLALQPDGKIIIGGNFTAFNGANRYHIARLNSDGSVDTTFKPGTGVNGPVYAVALQTNGQIVIGGYFTSVNGTNMISVARLNADGSLDASFNPGSGPDGEVNAIVIDSSGRVIIGGDFDSVAGLNYGGVARLNVDGSVDTTFNSGIGTYNPDTGLTDPVYALAMQGDMILVGGSFSHMELASYNGLVRLNADGTVDTTFNPGTGTYNFQTGLVDSIYAITLQPDGKILIGGDFTTYNQTRRVGIARLFDYGSLDTSFMDTAYNQFAGLINHYHNPDAINPDDYPQGNHRNFVCAIAVEPDAPNNVIIGGNFLRVGGGSVYHSGTDMSAQSGIFDNGRMDIHPRSNVARLIGGATPGPGNISLSYSSYSADKSAGTLYVSLVRTNGSLGMISAECAPQYLPPGAGIATADDVTGGVIPTWPTLYTVSPARSWTTAPGTFGPNYIYDSVYLGVPPVPDVYFNIINDTNITGNLNAKIDLSAPDGTSFMLGGEIIPLGAALGYYDLSPLTIIDTNIKPGEFGFSSPTYTVNQGSTAIITVTRTNGFDGLVQINYATADGTATSPANYTAQSGTLTFAPGVTSKSFTVPTTAGTTTNTDRTVNLILSSVTGGGIISQTNAVLTIVNNTFANGHIAFTTTNYFAKEDAGTASITVSRLGGSVGTLDVTAIVNGGTAVNGVNYIASTNTLHWNNTDVSVKTLSIPLIHDGIYTPDLTVNLQLTNGLANNVANSKVLGLSSVTNATLTIGNVDFPGIVQFASGIYSVKKSAGYALIPVVRAGGSAQNVTVNFGTLDGSAVNGANYTATNGVLTFTNGEIAKYFAVPILDDGQPDGLLNLNLVLSNATPGIALGSLSNAVLNIIDTASVDEPPGSIDTTYSPFAGFNGDVYALALQANNQLVVGGDFTAANGVPRQRLARLNANGSLDSSFLLPSSTMGADGQIHALAIQSDGRIIVGGFFSHFNGVVQNRITRLNYDGSLDSTFNAGSGADNSVYAVSQSPLDGKILVGGAFATLNGVTFNGIGRLNADGTPDITFNPGGLGAGSTGISSTVHALAIQSDGKIIIGGDFTTFNGVTANHLARLNTDGSLDAAFSAGTGANDSVRAIAIQVDGKILIGGLFTNYNGVPFNYVARLNPDGSVDNGFNPGVGANDMVSSIALQTDGRIVLGGQFTLCNGVTRNRVTRLNANGTVDPTINFGGGANDGVNAVVMQEDTIEGYPSDVPDEKIIIGGAFTQYNGRSQTHIARIFGGSMSGSGAFEFSTADYQVDETGANAFITVLRTGGTSGANADGSGDILVPFSTSDGSARAGVNYSSVVTNVSFPVGEVQKTVRIPVMDDGIITSNLTVNLAVNPLPPAAYGNQPTAVLTIINNDSAIRFATATYQIPKNVVNGVAPINITRLGSANGTASVLFTTTTNGTAVAGVDYTPITNQLVTFNPGVTNLAVTIPIINNDLPEGSRTVTMLLSNVVNSTLSSPSNATLTIIDTVNSPGSLAFSSDVLTVNEGDTNAYITVIRTNGVSGTVSASYKTVAGTALPGVNYIATTNTITFGSGVTSGTIVVPLVDNNLVQGPVNFNVTLFNPAGGATLTAPTNITVTVTDNDTGFAFLNATNYVRETNGIVPIFVQRIGGASGVAQVNYTTVNGTALAGVNYNAISGTLNFAAGEALKSISLPLIYDSRITGDLTLTMKLSNPSAGTVLGNPTNALIVVQDADAGFSFTNSTMSVFKNVGNAIITVVCSNPSIEPPVSDTNLPPLTVGYATADGTAVAGVDYQAASGTLYFTNGIGTNTISVPILNNSQVLGDHTFTVNLLNPTAPGKLVTPSSQTVTIVDNNSGLSFSSPVYNVLKTGAAATITVVRTDYTNVTSAVHFSTADGTAVGGTDYIATNGVLTFTNGEISKNFSVTVLANTTVQPDKTVLLQLSDPTNAFLIAPYAATLTIHDTTGSLVVPAGSTFAAGGDPNGNGLIDPGENVSLLFALRASGGTNIPNVYATLLATNGITSPSPATAVSYGPLTVGGHAVARQFSFKANGTNSQQIAATFRLSNGTTNIGTAVFTYTLGFWTMTFSNTNRIVINDLAIASPYPSSIVVTNAGGVIIKSVVTLTNLYHGFTKDIEALVVSPAGQDTLLMSHAGNGSASKVTLTFDDAATNSLPSSGVLTTGTNKPTAYPPTTVFP